MNLFERLGQPSPPVEKTNKQPRKKRDSEIFLKDILINGPVPTTLIVERAATHGLSKKQLTRARRRIRIVAFKETKKIHGRWFWVLPPYAPEL
jgi:hypothetical protein